MNQVVSIANMFAELKSLLCKGEKLRKSSKNDVFLLAILSAVDAAIENDKFSPGRIVLIPTEYTVLLNSIDYRDWSGIKRQALIDAIKEHIDKKLQLLSFTPQAVTTVCLRANNEVESGEIRVLAKYAKSDKPINFRFDNNFIMHREQSNRSKIENFGDEEVTQLRVGEQRSFALAIQNPKFGENLFPVFVSEITIGRDPNSQIVLDNDDLTISRHHATLRKTSKEEFWLSISGANSTWVNGCELSRGAIAVCHHYDQIRISNYIFTLKP